MKLPVHTQTNLNLKEECQTQRRISPPRATFRLTKISFNHLKKAVTV